MQYQVNNGIFSLDITLSRLFIGLIDIHKHRGISVIPHIHIFLDRSLIRASFLAHLGILLFASQSRDNDYSPSNGNINPQKLIGGAYQTSTYRFYNKIARF